MSAPSVEILPAPILPEVCFLGRSNVGKSSLLNSLCSRRALARVSKTPGRTQAFNFFRVDFEIPKGESSEVYRSSCHFVDLPGYGYAKVAKSMRHKWAPMIEKYLLGRPNLELVLLLIDSRREPGEEVLMVSSIGDKEKLIVVMTKSDKLSRNELAQTKKRLSQSLGGRAILGVSTLHPEKSELGVLRKTIFDSVLK